MVPMVLSEWPSLASLIMKASTSSGWYLHQFGGRLLTGLSEWDFPFSCFGIFVSLEHPKRTVHEYLKILVTFNGLVVVVAWLSLSCCYDSIGVSVSCGVYEAVSISVFPL